MAPDMTAQDRAPTDLSGASSAQDRSEFVSVAEAARLLKVSTATVKRRIRDGSLEAEPLSRPQGIEYRVRLPRDVTPALTEPASDVSPPLSDVTAPLAEASHSEQPALSTSAHVTTQDVSAAITAAVAPLAERLAVQDITISRQAETIERQAEPLVSQAETIGELRAENRALLARTAVQNEEALRELFPSRLRSWAPWLLLAAILLLALMVGLLLVPR